MVAPIFLSFLFAKSICMHVNHFRGAKPLFLKSKRMERINRNTKGMNEFSFISETMCERTNV